MLNEVFSILVYVSAGLALLHLLIHVLFLYINSNITNTNKITLKYFLPLALLNGFIYTYLLPVISILLAIIFYYK